MVISAADAKKVFDSDRTDYLIIDVRNPSEFQEGHVPHAINIPLSEIADAITDGRLPNKAQPLYVYCRSGRRSSQAVKTLENAGYTALFDFGGIMSWSYEVEK